MTDDEVYGHLLQLAKNADGLEVSVAKQIFNTSSPINRSLMANVVWRRGTGWVLNPFLSDRESTRDILVATAFDKEQMSRCYAALINEIQMERA